MKNVAIIRDRGQLTIPDNIRRLVSWVKPLSAVSIVITQPNTIVIHPHQTKANSNAVWKKIKNSRSILGKGKTSVAEFLINDRQR